MKIIHIHAEKVLSADQNKDKERLRVLLKALKQEFKEITIQDTIPSALGNFELENKEITLIALIKSHHGFFQKL